MHMKLSRLSSDMYITLDISMYIYARYTSMHACCMLCNKLSNKNKLYHYQERYVNWYGDIVITLLAILIS